MKVCAWIGLQYQALNALLLPIVGTTSNIGFGDLDTGYVIGIAAVSPSLVYAADMNTNALYKVQSGEFIIIIQGVSFGYLTIFVIRYYYTNSWDGRCFRWMC